MAIQTFKFSFDKTKSYIVLKRKTIFRVL